MEARSLEHHDYGPSEAAGRRDKLAEREAALNQMTATRTRVAEEHRMHLVTLSRPFPADPPQAHLSKPHRPHGSDQQRRTRFLELWAVISVPLLLSSIAVALTASPLALATTMLIFAGVFTGVEAIARRRFVSFLANLLLLLAGIGLSATLILLFLAHWRLAVSVLIALAALVLLLGNLLRR